MLRDLLPSAKRGGGVETQHVPRAPEAGGRKAGGVRLPYLPGLDGLRALAVIAVLLYHAGLGWIPGGFLGVEIFFVISGYLITTLLLSEWRQRGRIELKAFWLRRARRLLPALYLLLVVTLAFAVVFLPEEVVRLRNETLAALGYVTNWYLIFGQQSYFETAGRPSLLQHLWSLAVEEQFYVLWPLLLAAGLWGARMMRQRLVLLATLAGAVGSGLLMASLYQPDLDPSRLYYGTDTRATGLLAGAALAFVWIPGRDPESRQLPEHFRRRWERTAPLLLDAIGLGALGGLVWLCLQVGESQPFLFRGGFAAVALATVVVIMAVVDPRTHLGASLLGRQPLRWIGLRSYGIYLWHWPVFMVTRPNLDVPIDGLPLLALRLALTVVLAALSYRYVETPIRTGALGRAWRSLREAQGSRRRWLTAGWAGAVGTSVALCVVLGVIVTQAQPPAPPSYLSEEAVYITASTDAEDTTTTPEKADNTAPATTPEYAQAMKSTEKADNTAPATAPEKADDAASNIAPEATESTAPTVPSAAPSTVRVTAIGDSVMLGAAGELQRAIGSNLDIDAAVSRQAAGVIEILQNRRAANQLGDIVVIHIGNNGTFSAEQFDEIMRTLSGTPKVVFVNVKVPRFYEQAHNAVLADGAQRYPNVVLVDWYAASANQPELFAEDGYHLQIEGQRIYADLIAANLETS